MVESTYIPGVMGTLGGFGGMFAPDVAGMKKPVLVSGTDGVQAHTETVWKLLARYRVPTFVFVDTLDLPV